MLLNFGGGHSVHHRPERSGFATYFGYFQLIVCALAPRLWYNRCPRQKYYLHSVLLLLQLSLCFHLIRGSHKLHCPCCKERHRQVPSDINPMDCLLLRLHESWWLITAAAGTALFYPRQDESRINYTPKYCGTASTSKYLDTFRV